MSDFTHFSKKLSDHFTAMSTSDLFVSSIDPDLLWEKYLQSFPEGSNPIFRQRSEHDCQCCKHFIRNFGSVVSINDNLELVTIWDLKDLEFPYDVVAEQMSKFVRSSEKNASSIKDVFYTDSKSMRISKTRDSKNSSIIWNHFYAEAQKQFVKNSVDIASQKAVRRDSKEMFKRALDELTLNSIDTVIELINQNSLYRGSEFLHSLMTLRPHKIAYNQLTGRNKKHYYTWTQSIKDSSIARIRNTVIGTLLIDISNDVELDTAVRSFESKVTPTNYKRPTAIVTKQMIENAQKTITALGYENSLQRRHATLSDITINNILFADRSVKVALNVFDELATKVSKSKKTKSFDKVEEVSIETFLTTILPKCTSVEVQLENKHVGNFMSLIAPSIQDSKNILKWNNNFSWTYNGSLTDSVKERIKKAGGNVSGVLRGSLSWFNYDDLDLHCIEPSGNRIHFGAKRNSRTTGRLDVDMNVSSNGSREAVENITWTNLSKMQEGTYTFIVHNFTPRENIDVGFAVEVEYAGQLYEFFYDKKATGYTEVVKFEFSKQNGIKILTSLPMKQKDQTVWGITTNTFTKVKAIMKSPNYWDDNKIGNLHWFFILDECKNPDKIKGLFNEYVDNALQPHRKVLELLSSQLLVEPSDEQLSGVGFSQTKHDSLIVKLSGTFNRIIKLIF